MNSLSVTGMVAGNVCEMIIDTGSNITICRPDVLKRSGGESKFVLHPVNVNVKTATGEMTPIRNKGNLEIRIGATAVNHDVWVADIENECIIGLDFLSLNCCLVDVPGQCLRIGKDEVPLKRTYLESTPGCRKVLLAESCVIPPRSEALVPGKLDGAFSTYETWGSVCPAGDGSFSKKILVGRTLVTLGNSAFPVRVVNVSDASLNVAKGSELAVCEAVEYVSSVEPLENPKSNTEIPSHIYKLFERSSTYLDKDQKDKLHTLLTEYADIFSSGPQDIGKTSKVKHSIDTGESRPIRQPARRLPLAKLDLASKAIKEMSDQGVIESSSSPWTACKEEGRNKSLLC